MTKINIKRINALAQRIHAIPIPTTVVREALEMFRTIGELPEEPRLACAVVDRAKRGVLADLYEQEPDWGVLIPASMEAPQRPDDPLMDELYNEAVLGKGIVRESARHVLRSFAKVGLDPTQPQFAGKDMEIPDFGGVGIHLVGIPARLVRSPYKAQAKRLFARADRLRAAIPQGNQRWSEQLEDATRQFQCGGEWPDDPLLMESVLVLGEFSALMRHAGGEDVRELMVAFNVAATKKGEERRAAIGRLQELAGGDPDRS